MRVVNLSFDYGLGPSRKQWRDLGFDRQKERAKCTEKRKRQRKRTLWGPEGEGVYIDGERGVVMTF